MIINNHREQTEPFALIDGFLVRRYEYGVWRYLRRESGTWTHNPDAASLFPNRETAEMWRDEFDPTAKVFHYGF